MNPTADDLRSRINPSAVPRHVAVIMDGNGRWAQERGLDRLEGHRAGIGSIRRLVEACRELGVEVLTLYAFSTENWKRPRREVRGLMRLLAEYLREETPRLAEHDVRLRVLGDLEGLPVSARREVRRAVQATAAGRRATLNLALNYGGRAEILRAAVTAVREAAAGRLDPASLDEQTFAGLLDTAGLPDPDLLIRTGGEIRVSNFLLWQLAYTEFWFTPVYWPDFDREHFFRAVLDYQQRRRRFGALEPGD